MRTDVILLARGVVVRKEHNSGRILFPKKGYYKEMDGLIYGCAHIFVRQLGVHISIILYNLIIW